MSKRDYIICNSYNFEGRSKRETKKKYLTNGPLIFPACQATSRRTESEKEYLLHGLYNAKLQYTLAKKTAVLTCYDVMYIFTDACTVHENLSL